MYFSLKPKGKVLVNQNLNKVLENSKEFKIQNDANSGYNIQYFHKDSNNWVYIGNIDYYYDFDKTNVFLDSVDLVLYSLPEYVSSETIYESLLTLFSNAFGELELRNVFNDTNELIEEGKIETIAYSISISTQKGREIFQEKVDLWSGNKRKVLQLEEELKEFNDSFATMLLIEYLYLKSHANQQDQDKEYIAEIVEYIFSQLEKFDDEQFDIYLFKLMIGRKAVFSYLFNLLPKAFYLNKYGAQLSKLQNISSEVSQLLLIEYISACTGNMLKGSQPQVENVLELMEGANSIYLPEAKSMYTDFTTGKAKESLQLYKELSNERKGIRSKYKELEGDRSLIRSFEGFIKTHYYPRLSWSEKLLNYRIELTTTAKIAIISFISVIIFAIINLTQLLLKRNSFINDPNIDYVINEINGDLIAGYIFLSIILIFPVLFGFIYSIIYLRRKFRESTDKTLWTIITIMFSVVVAPFILIFFIFMVIVFQALATDGSFYAFDKDGIQSGYERINYDEMDSINSIELTNSECETTECSKSILLTYTSEGKESSIRIKDPVHYCSVSELVIKGAELNNIEIETDPVSCIQNNE